MRLIGENMIMNLQEKVKGMAEGIDVNSLILMESTSKDNLNQMVSEDDLIHDLINKIKHFLLMLENLGSFPIAWFDKVFPPETRNEQIQHWIHVGEPFAVLAFCLLLLFCCCNGCLSFCFITAFNILKFPFVLLWKILTCCIHCIVCILKAPFIMMWKILTVCFDCIRKGFSLVMAPFKHCIGFTRHGNGFVKMMKAPGRGYMMPRSRYEANPRGYFRGLRAGKR